MSYMSDKYETFECGCVRVRKCAEHDVTALREENARLLDACRQFMGPMGCGGNEGSHSGNCHMRFSTWPPTDCTCGVWLAKAALEGKVVAKFVLASERDELRKRVAELEAALGNGAGSD